MTSWNGFLVGGSRALFALGALAPFLGRQALIWFVDGGSFGLMIAYFLVCASFVVLRRREPDLLRPFAMPGGEAAGWFGLVASVALAALYLPSMPAALLWPQEWLMVIAWFVALGPVLYRRADA